MTTDVIGPSVQGEPVVYVSLFVVLVLYAVAPTVVDAVLTVVHEGGHVAAAVLTGRGPVQFRVNETTGGGLTTTTGGWGVGRILVALAGYLTPPLLGLAGVALVRDGKSWSVLWVSIVLLFAAFLYAEDLFTIVIVLLGLGSVAWVVLAGGPGLQAAVAVGLVWLLLLGGLLDVFALGSRGDAARLADDTWIPGFGWLALFLFVSVVSLWVGARRLIGI